MGRTRIPMELIQKERARKATFHKRKNGLMKKVYEFSTLCGVDACIIIYASDFEGQGPCQLGTWPEDTKEVHHIIEKYHNTSTDRLSRNYDVQEYYKDRLRKVEAEISKVRKEKLKIMYPTWDNSFIAMGQEQLRVFVNMLDTKLDACNKKINMLQRDLKGRAIAVAESHKAEAVVVTPLLASNSNLMNFMHNMSPGPAGQVFFPPLPMKPICDNNQQLASFNPFQLGQSSQSSMLPFGHNGMVDWAHQPAGAVANYDPIPPIPKIDVLTEDGAEINQNFLSWHYNGNIQAMQQPHLPYSFAPQTLPFQNMHSEAAFQTLPQGFQLNNLYDMNMLQPQMFDYMHGKN